MKMSLDELKVDSYSTQVSESELTEVKGGTSPACILYGIGVAVVAATTIIVASMDEETTTTTVTYDENGAVQDSTVVTTVIERGL